MINLFDIMQEARQGSGFADLSREFGLSSGETQRALAAILPAFSAGLNRSLYDPASFGQVIDLMVSGRYGRFFEGAGGAEVGQAGTDALLRFFGSPEIAQRVAEQGAAATGIGADIMRRMLPLVAATLVGGLVKHASLEGIGDLLGQWSEAFHRADAAARVADRRQAVRVPVPVPATNPFELWSSLLLPEPATSAKPPPNKPAPNKTTPSDPDDPVVTAIDAWSAMVSAMLGSPEQVPKAPDPPAPAVLNPLQILSRMFESGRDVQAQQVAQWRALTETVTGASRRT